MKTVHQEVSAVAGSSSGLKAATRALVKKYGRNRVLEAASDMSFSSMDPRINDRVDRIIVFVESLPPDMAPVRRNFGSLFAKKHDLAQYADKARALARPHRPAVENFLVHAPGKGGRGEAWYWLNGLQARDFEDAPSSFSPARYFTGDKPWAQLRGVLRDYGKNVKPTFIVIDTFTERVEGPLTEASIAARNNPDLSALRGQARQHLSLVRQEGRKAAKSATQKAISFADTAKNEAQLAAAQAKFATLRTAWNSLDLYCGPNGRPESGAMEKAVEELERAESRVGRTRRNPATQGHALLMGLLSTLFTIKNYAWTAHWNAKGSSFYGDHLLLERIYEKMDKSIDALGERVLAYTGQPVDYARLTQEMSGLSAKLSGHGGTSAFAHLLALVQMAQQQSDALRAALSSDFGGPSTSGLDNYLTDLNDRLDTFGYLLKQRQQE